MEKTMNVWTLVCKRLIVDEQTKLMTAVDIMEKLTLNVNIEKAPLEIQESLKKGLLKNPIQVGGDITVVSYWNIGQQDRGKDFVLETVIKDHNSRRLGKGELPFKTSAESSYHKTFVKLPSFPVTGSGMYTVSSVLKDSQNKQVAKKIVPMVVELNKV